MTETAGLTIRCATEADFGGIWSIFHEVIQGGDSYFFSPDTSEADAREYWLGRGVETRVVEDRGWILGMYRLVENQRDLGSHVASASFMVAPGQQGRGIGTMMGRDCLAEAKHAGFSAIQFSFVVSTNESSVRLWKKLGFAIVGIIPKAFRHATLGFVDVYVMHRFLDDIAEG